VAQSSNPPRPDAGFTLLEVLIAMLILAIGLLALEGVAVGAARTTAHASHRSLYTTVATDALERTLSSIRESQAVSTTYPSVTSATGGSLATVAIQVDSTAAFTSPSPPMKRFDVTVRVVPSRTADAMDSVRMVASVIR
jgi:type IV pilus assembly protein PilV